MERFKNRVAVITGGADGIGKALGVALAARGMRVALLDIREEAAQEAAAEIGGAARGYLCDVTLKESIDAAATIIEADFGAIALLCANAGVGAGGRAACREGCDHRLGALGQPERHSRYAPCLSPLALR